MSESKHFYFDGKSAMPVDQFINLVGGVGIDGRKTSLVSLFAKVSWLYRGIALLENGVSSMPFEIRKGNETVYEFDPNSGKQDTPPKNLEFLIDIPHLSGMVNGAATLLGQAYILNWKNKVRTWELRWMNPTTITPDYDSDGQVEKFVRTIQGREKPLAVEDVIWFWSHDKFVENGPAQNVPGKAALAAAGVLHSQDEFLRGYFDRGLVSAGFLKYEQQISSDEKRRVKEWWNRMTSGIRAAFNNLIVRGDFSYEQIGGGLKDLENTALTNEQRESIATALGIPQSKMTQPPGGLGDTKTPDDLMFVTDTIIPACTWIARAWNRRYFMERGYMMLYTPQKLPIMQQDEERRSIAFRNYVGSGQDVGYTVEAAQAILGIHVPDEVVNQVRKPVQQIELESKEIEGDDTTIQGKSALHDVNLLDWRDERDQFLRWLDNRKGKAIEVDDFKSSHLSLADKREIYQQWQNDEEINGLLDDYADMMEKLNV